MTDPKPINIDNDSNSSDNDEVILECHNEIPIQEEPWWSPVTPSISEDYEGS